ncbi:Ribosome biogenesis protein NOC1 [Golovinomyces cichoracearum]|uniref:Ribosome biogenesis protein NOC1 n=1 Tax=Golovinomyces cichoracearum TaxID=62708 RepID=A0A420IYM9_9PEZI|nr:Ribosome biogenesis protein NOC1 [Golovinomyces cichoracearum]
MGKRKHSSPDTTKHSENQDKFKIPKLDERALSALTSRIEKELGRQKQSGKKNEGSATEKRILNTSSQKRKKQKNVKSPKTEKRNEVTGLTKEKLKDIDRSSNGSREDVDTNPSHKYKKSENHTNSKETLLREILALGGTQEDLDLVGSVASDSEEELGKPSDPLVDEKSFKNELDAFVAKLGIKPADSEIDAEPSLVTQHEEPKRKSGSSLPTSAGQNAKFAGVNKELDSPLPPESKGSNRLIFEARPDWHAAPLPTLPSHEVENPELYNDAIVNLKEYASKLLEIDSNLYASKHLSSSSSQRFLSTIMKSGTLSDKVSALTLVIQESPVHTTKSFENLLNLAKKRSRGQAVIALAALKDLLGTGAVLPENRRLKTFSDQPSLLSALSEDSIRSWSSDQRLPGGISNIHLISWIYEDWLKKAYFDMLKIMETWCNDEVEYARSRVVTYVYELLRDKPEQEANLLRLLVNKLGDPDKKIASRTSFLILQLQTSHPLMKPIIIRSIETEILLRPGQSMHAKYYSITTLNQTILSVKESEIAKNLLRIYFDSFILILKKPDLPKPNKNTSTTVNRKGDIQGGGGPIGKKALIKEQLAQKSNEEADEKMISAILTGVNRAFPFSKSDDITLEGQMDTLFRVTHSSNFNTSIQALILIEQLATSKNLSVDRFYRTLYESLLDPRLVTSSKHTLYLNLLYKSLRSDIDVTRVKAFVKRMVQVITLHQPPFICGILFLIRELIEKFPSIKSIFTEPEEDESDEEIYFDVHDESTSAREQESRQRSRPVSKYDGRKRDPRHCNVKYSCLWELIPFTCHFHPSVSLFATRLLYGGEMPPKPDLASHSLTNFLDRFVYRNAKASSSKPKGNSIMQPLCGDDSKSIFLSYKIANSTQQPLNSEAFWRKKSEEVAVHEVFFHKYFNHIGNSKHSTAKPSKKSKQPDESDDGEDEIWQALVKSKPDVEGPDSDSEFSDLDDSYSEYSAEYIDDNKSDEENLEILHSDIDKKTAYSSDEDSDVDCISGRELITVDEKETEENGKKNKKKKARLRDLPLFASVDEYAKVLENEKDEEF